MHSDPGFSFGLTMRLLFGEKANRIAGAQAVAAERRQWFRRAVRKLTREAGSIDTTTRHSEMLLSDLGKIDRSIRDADEPEWMTVCAFLALTARLLGYDMLDGQRHHTPTFHRSPEQYYRENRKDPQQEWLDERNAIRVRRDLVHQLKEQGFDTFQISLVFNTSEYAIKKLIRG